MSVSEKRLQLHLTDLLKDGTPGACVQVFHSGKKKIDVRIGKVWKLYDLASLTKVLATTSLCMDLVSKKKVKLNSSVKTILPYWRSENSLSSFLNHSSGLEWWVPLYQEMPSGLSFSEARLYLRRKLQNLVIAPSEKCVYSDPDFWVLGEVIESLTDSPLDVSFHQLMDDWNLSGLVYHRRNKPIEAKSNYAPTENCQWRKRILQGEVHDENTWALGGVAAHSGLFGSVDAVSSWGLFFRKAILSGTRHLDSSVARTFAKRSVPTEKGDWALGFMMPSQTGSSAGEKFSKSAVGHTGFTGTSIWWDPKVDLLVVILSNRVHPTRENSRFVKLRSVIHDAIYSEVIEGSSCV